MQSLPLLLLPLLRVAAAAAAVAAAAAAAAAVVVVGAGAGWGGSFFVLLFGSVVQLSRRGNNRIRILSAHDSRNVDIFRAVSLQDQCQCPFSHLYCAFCFRYDCCILWLSRDHCFSPDKVMNVQIYTVKFLIRKWRAAGPPRQRR